MVGTQQSLESSTDADSSATGVITSLILSFDVEEHDRIEAAAGLRITRQERRHYAERMELITRRLLERLACTGTQATFFIVGEIARSHPRLIRDIVYAGHEIGAHSWSHRRVSRFSPVEFLEDARITKDALEQASGFPVFGFRAPTFSITQETSWAIDGLLEAGYSYDSSIYPVRHDRYGVPDAPRGPFMAVGPGNGELLELPPATFRMLGQNLPVAGGGYFRLLPLWATQRSLARLFAQVQPRVAMMYFHPWEFDTDQLKLPLPWLSRWRTYVGVSKNMTKLEAMLNGYIFRRAIDVVTELHEQRARLPRYEFANGATVFSARAAISNRVATGSTPTPTR